MKLDTTYALSMTREELTNTMCQLANLLVYLEEDREWDKHHKHNAIKWLKKARTSLEE